MSKASIIIVNYNGENFISDCLKALEAQTSKDFEIVIVDNGSTDNSLNVIRSYLKENPLIPSTKLISLDKNLGFTGGNIEGLKNAKGEYIALLNNDIEADRR